MRAIISIIVPIYNVEKYLKRCIESILKQSFKEFELILVDDGSPDNCGEICTSYLKKDHRIKVIHKENGGLSDARNAGLEIASGDYIAFIDSDDYINKNMLKILYEAVVETKSDIAQCKFKYFSDEAEIDEESNTKNNYKVYSNLEAINSVIDNGILNANVWNKIYSRHLFDDIRFPKGKVHEDEYVTYKVFYKANQVCYVDEELYYYFNNPQGIMRSKNLLKRFDWIEAVEERNIFLKKINEIGLYDKSKSILFFNTIKLKYLISKENDITNKEKYLGVINEKVKVLIKEMKNNTQLSFKNKLIIDLANINEKFINIYNINNWRLSKKYK